jgi:ring-1,2-phenylacetyl-CoA epoxidase subunit PaaC
MDTQQQILQYVLRLGDNALISGHRLGEWCSNAPILEEDLALTNFALDYIGRAENLYQYASKLENKGHNEDFFAYRRSERDFQNHLLVELPNNNFADTMARLWFFSLYEYYFYSELCNSHDETLAAIAQKAIKEIKYHLKHTKEWVLRLGDGTSESHYKMQKAINDYWMYTGELFEMDTIDHEILNLGIGINPQNIYSLWLKDVRDTLNEAQLQIPEDNYMQTGGKKGIHTEFLGFILADMQYLQRAYPDAQW